MNQSKPKLWTKDFIIVSSVNFLLTLVFFLLMVTISLYAVEQYDASTSQAGLVTGIFIIGVLTGRLFIGRFIERIGHKKTLFFGLIFFTLTTALYYLSLGIHFLLLTRYIHGFTLGIVSTAAGTIVAHIIPAERKGEGIGYFSMSSTLAMAIGPFIGLYMTQLTRFEIIFSFCLVICVINLITAWFVHVPVWERKKEASELNGFQLSNFVEPKALPIAFVTLVIALCFSSILSFINFYAIEINLVHAASFFFAVYAIAVLVSRPFTGRLMDQKGANFIMYPAFFVLAAGMLLLSTANNSFTFLASGVLIGLGFGNMQSCFQAVAIKLTPTHRMGLATSTFFIFLDAGLGFGPYLIGFLIPLTGYQSLYVILSVVILSASILYYLLHGKRERNLRARINVSTSAFNR